MAKVDLEFTGVVREILKNGRMYTDKSRDTQRLQIPSHTFRHEMKDGFPAVTVKKLAFKSVVGELLWFLQGKNNIKDLVDNQIPIWNDDAYNWYRYICRLNGLYHISQDSFIDAIKKGRTMEDLKSVHGGTVEPNLYKLGDVGQNYSKQWRSYAGKVDQIVDLIKEMEQNIMSTRLKVEAWNPAEKKDTALPPCHTGFQIVGVPLTEQERIQFNYDPWDWLDICNKGCEKEALEAVPQYGFELHWNQRSVDTFLGLGFNIASYALLGLMLEAKTGYPMIAVQGDLKAVHLYQNSFRKSEELLLVDPYKHKNCELKFNSRELFNKNLSFDQILEQLSVDSFELVNYTSEKRSNVKMLAPIEL